MTRTNGSILSQALAPAMQARNRDAVTPAILLLGRPAVGPVLNQSPLLRACAPLLCHAVCPRWVEHGSMVHARWGAGTTYFAECLRCCDHYCFLALYLTTGGGCACVGLR
jgi:hypothetical protein